MKGRGQAQSRVSRKALRREKSEPMGEKEVASEKGS